MMNLSNEEKPVGILDIGSNECMRLPSPSNAGKLAVANRTVGCICETIRVCRFDHRRITGIECGIVRYTEALLGLLRVFVDCRS
jgi:hypothetical protein